MISLPPLIMKDGYYSGVEAEINRILYDIIYRPLLEILGMREKEISRELKNSAGALHAAISQGKIWFENGEFKGKFNSKTSSAMIRLGARYDVKSGTYKLPESKLPVDLKFAQAQANSRYELMRLRMLSAIDNMKPEMVDQLSTAKQEYEKTLAHMEGDLQKTLKAPDAVSLVSVEAKLTEAQKSIIANDWANNLNLYIKKWTEESILKLRQDIQPHVMAGGRAEGLVKNIQDQYGVSARKAKFLARQETSLLMSKFQESRYKDIGIQKYRWSGANDARERPDHRKLNGKVFRFDSPPVTNHKTGARNNPGEDYNCRCVAIPIVD